MDHLPILILISGRLKRIKSLLFTYIPPEIIRKPTVFRRYVRSEVWRRSISASLALIDIQSGGCKALQNKGTTYCVSLLKKYKKKGFANLNEKNIVHSKLFLKAMKSLFSTEVYYKG